VPIQLTILLARLHAALLAGDRRYHHEPRRCASHDERVFRGCLAALVLLAAALVALLVIAWATAGGGAARIGRLFNSVIDSVIDKV